MYRLWSHHADARMPVFSVIPSKEGSAMSPAVLLRPKTPGEAGSVLERFEMSLRIRIVVGDMGPTKRFGNSKVRQLQGHGLAGHGRTSVGVYGKLILRDPLPSTGFLDELFSQSGAFHPRQQPARNISAEDVEDDVKVVIGPFHRAQQLGDVPRPDLVGRCGQQFGGASPAISPRSRAARHDVRWEEYKPSLRNNSPSSPGCRHSSAAFNIFLLYSALNLRLSALPATSTSGTICSSAIESMTLFPSSPSTLNYLGSLSHLYWQRGR